MDNNQTNIEQAEIVANIVQIGINGIAGHYGDNTGKAFSNFLTGNGAVVTSIGDLVYKINDGTATSKDIADALQDIASIVAGFGYMAGYANPWVFSTLFIVGVIKGIADYVDVHPELTQEMKDIFNNPANLKEWIDIWNFFNDEYQIAPTVNTLYNAAQEWMSPPPPRRRIDPLVLDLDGDGIETVGITSTSHVVFDGEGDGLKTGSGWVGKDDGLLVFDRNGNGVIDNGSELFGDQTLVNGVKATDGFSALRAEDTNADGKFDATDTNYANVRVWQDLNQDGISQTTELKTLTDLGIASINLTSTATNITTKEVNCEAREATLGCGNLQTATSTYTKSDGTTKAVGNLNFVQNAFYREYTDHLTLTDAALALPDMQGSGLVYSNNQNFKNVRSVA